MIAEGGGAPLRSAKARNNARITGTGTPLLFAHGFGCDQSVWRHVTPAFSDHQVVLFDHVGAGGSDLNAYNRFKYGRLNGYATDMIELCEELDLKATTLVSHSVSGVIAMLAGIRRPDLFRAVVMVAPSPCYVNVGDYVGGFTSEDIEGLLSLLDANHLGWSAAMAPLIMGNAERPELAKELEGNFCRTDPEIARHFARVTFLSNHLGDLASLSVPSLTLQCSDDRIAPFSVGEYMHSHMRGNELITMAATGHCPHLSAPDETIAEIRRFVSSMAQATPC